MVAIRQEQNATTKKQAMALSSNEWLSTLKDWIQPDPTNRFIARCTLSGRLEWKNTFDNVYGNI